MQVLERGASELQSIEIDFSDVYEEIVLIKLFRDAYGKRVIQAVTDA